jgi:hypothetical protein
MYFSESDISYAYCRRPYTAFHASLSINNALKISVQLQKQFFFLYGAVSRKKLSILIVFFIVCERFS